MGLLDLFVNRAERDRNSGFADVIPSGVHVNAVEIGEDADWVRVVPFGNYPFHHSGAHAITPEAGAQMVANFEARPGGLLFDIDHDSLWGRTKAAAWSNALEVREDGVYCRRPEITSYGQAEVSDKQYCFFSPVYALASVNKAGDQIGALLLSVAYTNTPYFNEGEIDVAANSILPTQPPRLLDAATLTLLGLTSDATDEQIANAAKELHTRANAAPATPAPDPSTPAVAANVANPGHGDAAVTARLEAIEVERQTERDERQAERVTELVSAAVNSGRIKPVERAVYLNAAKTDFAATKAELEARAEGSALPGRLNVNSTARPAGTASALSADAAAYVNSQTGKTA